MGEIWMPVISTKRCKVRDGDRCLEKADLRRGPKTNFQEG
jgi:hypothetical protein